MGGFKGVNDDAEEHWKGWKRMREHFTITGGVCTESDCHLQSQSASWSRHEPRKWATVIKTSPFHVPSLCFYWDISWFRIHLICFSFEGFPLRWIQLIRGQRTTKRWVVVLWIRLRGVSEMIIHFGCCCSFTLPFSCVSSPFASRNCFINGKNNLLSPNCCWWISPSATDVLSVRSQWVSKSQSPATKSLGIIRRRWVVYLFSLESLWCHLISPRGLLLLAVAAAGRLNMYFVRRIYFWTDATIQNMRGMFFLRQQRVRGRSNGISHQKQRIRRILLIFVHLMQLSFIN